MSKKNAIVFSSVFFNSKIKVGSHHYAEALSREGYKVLYVSFPVSIVHFILFLKNDNFIRIFKRFRCHNIVNIHSFIPFSILPLFNIFPFNSLFIMKKWVWFSDFYFQKRIKNYFLNVDVIWVESAYFISAIQYIKRHNPSVKIYTRLSDNVLAFNNFPSNYIHLLNESFLISDKIIVSAKSLINIINKKYSSKILHLPNGINTNQLKSYSIEKPPEFLIDKNETKIVYVGALENWFDWDIISYLLDNIPNISIYIIGPLNGQKINIRHKNLNLLGAKSHSEIGRYLFNANIGIIPFKRNNLIDYVDPIKFYEYSYFKIPTVCTYWEEVSRFNDKIILAKDKYEFCQNIEFLIKNNYLKGEINVNLTDRDWQKNLQKVLK